ncbi:LysM peptidoglycan-binding domain-containing protein [Arsenicicoccus piscis]|nr:LysM domain-containing protein [Arsenicicoccus piscis]MCH8628295.1 LysM peptidoglycan-binding domain-containing protein [Arsenicicoccus piscis]
MTSTMPRPGPAPLRVAALLVSAVAAAGLALLLAWQQGAPTVQAVIGGHGPQPTSAALLVAIATVAACLLVAWIATGVGLAALAVALPHRPVARVAERLAPSALRRLAAALVGAALLSGPASGLAHATARPTTAGAINTGPTSAGPTSTSPTSTSPTSTSPTHAITADGDTPEEPVVPRFVPSPPPRIVHTPPPAVAHRLVHDDEVVVRRGDTLWDLAARHLGPGATVEQVAAAWPRWYARNRAVIGSDPGLLLPGQRLRPPTGGRA